MKFTIRPGASNPSGGFAVSAMSAREALDTVRDMSDRGLSDIEVFDADGTMYDLIELQRLTAEGEASDDRRW